MVASGSGAVQANGEFSEFRSRLRCGAGTCTPLAGSSASVRDVLLRTEDRADPTASLSGSIFDGEAVRGTQTAAFRISDRGGGVRELELLVNDQPVFADVLNCAVNGDRATALRPCAGAASRAVSLPTSAEPFDTGVNRIKACGTDLALDGLPNEDCQTREVFVDDLCPASSVGGGSSVSAFFPKGKDRLEVRSDHEGRLKGKLGSGPGAGVAGATICVLTRADLAGEPYEVAATATTDENGRFELRLPPGPNRTLYVHRVFGDQILARHGLSLASKVRPSLEIKPRTKGNRVEDGDRLKFKGELPGPGCDRRVVKVQAKIGKKRWQVFRTIRTNDNCHYKTRFKLRATSRRTRYAFRVRVPEQADYPYEAGVSAVRVREAGPKKHSR